MKKILIMIVLLFSFIGCVMAQVPVDPVQLQWNSNIEEDMAGYNMYRSNEQGTGYIQINTELIPHTGAGTENYIDDTVRIGKKYWYVATALNTSEMESGYSNEAYAFVRNPNAPAHPLGLIVIIN